ncbi:MAG TPA: protein kinase [Halieaceae bacterium]|nr:protein kinase [Halieaceae bacterium]
MADALHHYLKHELVPKFEGKDKFLAQIAASTARTLARSARYRDTLQAQEERRLRALLDLSGTCHELNALLCQQLRNRVIGLDDPRLQAHLRATVEGQVQIDQPQYLAFSQRGA